MGFLQDQRRCLESASGHPAPHRERVVADAVVVSGPRWDTTLSESSLITSSGPELPVVAAPSLAFALSSLPSTEFPWRLPLRTNDGVRKRPWSPIPQAPRAPRFFRAVRRVIACPKMVAANTVLVPNATWTDRSFFNVCSS